MKRFKLGLAIVVASGILLSTSYPAGGGPLVLIKIPKGAALSERLLDRLQIDVRQELETCLLALADREDIPLLRKRGVRLSILDRDARNHDFLVVSTSVPGALESLKAAGRAIAVEPGAAVFWTEYGASAESVPSALPRKALAPRSILPYVKLRHPAGHPAPPAAAQDPFVETIVSLVSSSDLSSSVQTLQDFQTRYASTTNCEAAGESLFSSFTALGLDDVHFAPFTFSGSYSSRNVVAEKTGETYPDDIFVICSHYDSTSPSRQTLAPGADDNASGTAAVLETARALAPYPLDFTVRFIAFSAEEWGLYGSRAYAAAARQAGERIIGVINLDMIAYADAMPEDLQIIVNPASGWLADLFLVAASNYGGLGATKTVDASFVYSDHAPFWDSGYPALLAIEDEPLNNPYYHQTSDTLDKLNFDFFTNATRAALGLLAELAQPIKDGYPKTPVGLTASPVVYSSLFNALKTVRLTWTAQADAAGYNLYRTNSSHLGYTKINSTLLIGTVFTDNDVTTDKDYYYVVTAVGTTGLESNRSRQVAISADIAASSSAVFSLGLLTFGGIR
jgi:Peptidase family M28